MNLHKILRQSYLTSSLLIGVCTFGTAIAPVNAEGSKDLYPSGATGNRGHIEWRNSQSGGYVRRTLLRVYAEAGQYILVGSSAVGISNNGNTGDIEIYGPGDVTGNAAEENIPTTADFRCSEQRTTLGTNNGFIANRSEELAGPQSIDGAGNTAGYIPCYYQAPTTGIYYLAIYGPNGKGGSGSANAGAEILTDTETINTDPNQGSGVSAWDVTIRESQSSTTDLEGRLHTYHLSMTLGNNGRELNSSLYPITIDGYRYRIDFNGIDPYAFRIYGNLLGNLDSDGASPLYKDVVLDAEDSADTVGSTSSAPPQFPLFFNEIDPTILSSLQVYDPITGEEDGTGFAAVPFTPNVSSPTYSGNVSGNKSTINEGGTFTFDSNITGVYEITISRDGNNFDPTSSENRVLRGLMQNGGTQTIVWDGLDNSGEPFPVGEFEYKVQIHAGEYHFPLSDAENNFDGGPSYTLLNGTNPLGNTTAFYDHRGYYTVDGDLVPDRDTTDGDPTDDALCGTNPPDPAFTDPVNGADSTDSNFNKFGVDADEGATELRCNGSFGNAKILDLWTYRPSTPIQQNLVIVEFDYGDAPISYDDTADNNDIIDENDSPAEHTPSSNLYLGSVAADAEVAPQSSSNADGDDDATAPDVDDEDGVSNFPALDNSDDSYSLTATVNNTSDFPANVFAWIDFDLDGEFDEDERATVANGTEGSPITLDDDGKVPTDSNGTVTLNWSNLGSTGADVVTGNTYVRIRLTTDNDLDATADTDSRDDASVGTASNGEVEDYLVAIDSDDGNRPLGFPFTCDSTFYITIGENNFRNGQFTGEPEQELFRVNRSGSTFTFDVIGPITQTSGGYPNNFAYNALAYNPEDNYIYGYIYRSKAAGSNDNSSDGPYGSGNMVKIGSDGILHSLGVPQPADSSVSSLSGSQFAATFLSDGTYIIGGGDKFAKIDVTTEPPTIRNTSTISGTSFTDFAVDPTDPTSTSGARVYGIEEERNKLVVLDLTDTNPKINETLSPDADPGVGDRNAGSQFVDSFGTLYYRSNADDKLYRVDSDPSSDTYGKDEEITTGDDGGNHDGASCLFASAMEKEVQDLEGNTIDTIPAGETVNYVYTIASGNTDDLTGVTFTDDLRNVASGDPINGTFTGNVTVDGVDVSSSADVSFSNDNQTIEISNLTIPAQTGGRPGEILTVTAEVKVPSTLAVGDYFNQAFINGLPATYPPAIASDYPPSAAYEDPTPLSVTADLLPNLLLVKRITAINPGQSNEILFDEFVDDATTDEPTDIDNDPNWSDPDTYLPGAISVDNIQPGDEVEYTIYFLSNGEEEATNVQICDVIPDNMTFVTDSYDTGSGITFLNSSDFTTATATNLTNADDTDGDTFRGRFYAPGTPLPTITVTTGDPPTTTTTNLCKKVDSAGNTVDVTDANNTNGAVVVGIDEIPDATAPEDPDNAYGFIRFRARVQ